MRISTAFMFAVAFICAGVAAFLVRGMINTSGDAGAVAVAPPPVKKIVVAAKDLKPGETLTADNLRVIDWAGAQLPKGSLHQQGRGFEGG